MSSRISQNLTTSPNNVNKPLRVTNTFDSGPGSLRNIIGMAVSGDTIVFDDAILPGLIILTSGAIPIETSLTINGPGTDRLKISGDNNSRIFIVDGTNGANVTIKSITFINGFDNTGNGGGAILNENGAELTVRSCAFSNNSAPFTFGGAIANVSTMQFTSIVNIENSTFTDNFGNFSGAIGNLANGNLSGTMNLRNSTLANNSANVNGGGFVNDGTAAITNSTFSGNSALNGGAFANQGITTIANSTFSSNIAANNGGAVANFNGGTIDITNSTFSGNSAANSGGGIANISVGTINILRCMFINNIAATGGAFANLDSGTITDTNSTFSNNMP